MKTIKGIVRNAEVLKPLQNVKIYIYDQYNNKLNKFYSDQNGNWKFNIEKSDKVVFSKKGYNSKQYTHESLSTTVRLLRDKLIGYQEKHYFYPSETIRVFVNSSKPYKARLFRHGLQKVLVLDLGEFPLSIQQVPDTTFVYDGLNWKVSFSYKIPDQAPIGLYSLLLSENSSQRFAIPFIISSLHSNKNRDKILVLASNNNWLAYNIWGGRNRYRNYETEESKKIYNKNSLWNKSKQFTTKLLPSPIKNKLQRYYLDHLEKTNSWQFSKLSIKRPLTNCSLEDDDPLQPFTNHLAAGEWRVLAWLERERYQYDIILGYELHSYPDILKEYNALICSTHCEYWSKEMYYAVKEYHHKNKLWIINLSGNTMFREIEFYDDGSLRCVSLKFGLSVEDETSLLGVRFTEDDYGTAAPYKIIDKNHWAFKGVLVGDKYPVFGEKSLNQHTLRKFSCYDPGRPNTKEELSGSGASGWETDKLSHTAPKDFKLIAKGMNKSGGADMVVREPKGTRGGVFSSSSILFGGCLLIDNTASTITKNILNKAIS